MSNNVLNLSENNSNEDKKKVRRNKKEYYNTERENILQELKILMELDKDNSILLAKLRDNDKLKQKLFQRSGTLFYRNTISSIRTYWTGF